MNDRAESRADERGREVEYQAPRVERVLGPADLEREVLYAGEPTGIPA